VRLGLSRQYVSGIVHGRLGGLLEMAPAFRRRPVLEPVGVEQIVARRRLEHEQLEPAAVTELGPLPDD
jgi:hypothetical protein